MSKFKEEKPEDFNELIRVISDVASELIDLIQEPNLDKYAILDYVSMNQQYLQELGVSSPEIDDIVATCMENEIHAKITGAGGGGCVVCFPKDPEFDSGTLFKQFTSKGYTVFDKVEVSKDGLTYKLNE